MREMIPVKTPAKRRRFSADFKAKIVAASNLPDASVASVALANNLNANMVHRWRRQARDQSMTEPAVPDFMPVTLQEHNRPEADTSVVTFEVGSIKVHWPLAHIQQSIAWLHRLQS